MLSTRSCLRPAVRDWRSVKERPLKLAKETALPHRRVALFSHGVSRWLIVCWWGRRSSARPSLLCKPVHAGRALIGGSGPRSDMASGLGPSSRLRLGREREMRVFGDGRDGSTHDGMRCRASERPVAEDYNAY